MAIHFISGTALLGNRREVFYANHAGFAGTVLLGEGRVGDLGRRFQTGGGAVDSWQLATLFLILLAVIIAVCLIARHLNRREQATYHAPRRLFRELCSAHRLSRPERKLLWAVAQHLELEHPAVLFVDPLQLESRRLGDSFRSVEDQLATLRKRIFSNQEASG